MHTRTDFEKDIRKIYGNVGLLSESQIKEYANIGRDRLKTMLLTIPHFGNGRGKRYAVTDVAELIANGMNRK